MLQLEIEFPYMVQDGVMKIAKSEGVTVKERSFDNVCRIIIEYPEQMSEIIRNRVSKVEGAMPGDEKKVE